MFGDNKTAAGYSGGGSVQMWPDNSGGSVPPVVGRTQDLAACLAYVAKYRRIFGRDPDVWCVGQTQLPGPAQIEPPRVETAPTPAPWIQPVREGGPAPRIEPPPSPPGTSPPIATWGWRRRKPPVKRPWVPPAPRPRPVPMVAVAQELCPIRGYVSREIPGANEYQNFRCTPGQPVVIDAGLQAVGRQEALARHGLSGLDGFAVGNIDVPTWALVAGAAVLGMMLLKKGRR